MPQAVESYLRSLKMPDVVKADAWDAVYTAKDDADAEARMRRLPVPNEVRAQLWDLRAQAVTSAPALATPPPAAATAGMLSPSTAAGDSVMSPAPSMAARLGAGAMDIARGVMSELGGTTARREGLRFGHLRPDISAALEGAEVMGSPITPATAAGLKVAGRAATAVKPWAWPTRAAAGQKFQQVMSKAADVPVDTSAPERVAYRIWELAGGMGKVGRGGSLPKPVSDFIKRMTDPKQGPMLYQESRDFASNLSRLSAKDWSSVNPVIGAEIHKMRVALHAANAKAAAQAGKGPEYLAAMKEYARAAGRRKMARKAGKEVAKWAVPVGLAGAGYRVFSGD